MAETVFSKIIAGEIPCAKVYEDEHTFALMDAGQANPGHVLVATRKPAETILDLDEDLAVALFRTLTRIAKAVQSAFEPEGLTLLQANKPAGFQAVPHFHIHILPRYADDGVGLVWPKKDPDLETLREYAAKIALD